MSDFLWGLAIGGYLGAYAVWVWHLTRPIQTPPPPRVRLRLDREPRIGVAFGKPYRLPPREEAA